MLNKLSVSIGVVSGPFVATSKVGVASHVVRSLSSLSSIREPTQPKSNKKPKYTSASEAVSVIKSGDTVWMQGVAAAPKALAKAMADYGLQNKQLRNVTVGHLMSLTTPDYVKPELKDVFRVHAAFVSGLDREAVNDGRADYLPVFLSEVPLLFRRGIYKPRVAMLQVSSPDEHGYLSMGVSVCAMRDILKACDIVIGEVNPRQPRTFGDSLIHESNFDYLVQNEVELDQIVPKPPSDVEKAIGKHIAENLVEDGCTLQTGIGGIPDAVLSQCKQHKDLGVHSEMFSDSVMELIKSGNINNRLKKTEPGLLCATFLFGSTKFYDFFHNNPYLVLKTCDYTNDQDIIAQNPKVTAINSCIEIDIIGQVASDTVGTTTFSGYGGQVDFLRGAALGSDGKGKPILALSAMTNKGVSKIVPFLKHGAGVTTSRAHVHYVVTEFGIASLFGKNYRQRAYELIQIAHPDHRASLEKAAFERLKCMPSKD
ncbi:succinyl-CoA:acetate/propanoyl-CoA:succinate CoA transferase-like [Brevipalpus obovatus]|uniref:succinyl-CoA:acetate/propanoyl-CoA:succinate CoA transferase-like n=1 Tax=Brevipalpus obovatus TaxID=246614 RepID=UPI003D9DF7B1